MQYGLPFLLSSRQGANPFKQMLEQQGLLPKPQPSFADMIGAQRAIQQRGMLGQRAAPGMAPPGGMPPQPQMPPEAI